LAAGSFDGTVWEKTGYPNPYVWSRICSVTKLQI